MDKHSKDFIDFWSRLSENCFEPMDTIRKNLDGNYVFAALEKIFFEYHNFLIENYNIKPKSK